MTNVPADAIQVVNSPDRKVAEELMRMRQYIDVLIPRGGADLIKTVVETSHIPVIETGTGNCHVYVEEDADLEKATPIVINSKCQTTRNMQRRRETAGSPKNRQKIPARS